LKLVPSSPPSTPSQHDHQLPASHTHSPSLDRSPSPELQSHSSPPPHPTPLHQSSPSLESSSYCSAAPSPSASSTPSTLERPGEDSSRAASPPEMSKLQDEVPANAQSPQPAPSKRLLLSGEPQCSINDTSPCHLRMLLLTPTETLRRSNKIERESQTLQCQQEKMKPPISRSRRGRPTLVRLLQVRVFGCAC